MLSSLSSIDHSLFWLINAHHTPFFDGFFSIITWLGDGGVVTPVLLVIGFLKIPRSKLLPFILFSTVFMVASGIVNSRIKETVRRPRPLVVFSNGLADTAITHTKGGASLAVHVVGQRLSWNSFPSGHSNTAFSSATLLALRFGGVFWMAYPVALLVGYSRVYMGAHFPSDVAAGGMLGIVVIWLGLVIYNWYDRKGEPRHDKQ